MKKKVLIITIICIFTASTIGCGSKRECEQCKEKKSCAEYEISCEGISESGWLCKDCAKDMKAEFEEKGGTVKKK